MEGKRKNSDVQDSAKKIRGTGVHIRNLLSNEDSKTKLREAWVNDSCVEDSNLNVLNKPFKCCIVKDLIDNEGFLKNLVDELSSLNLVTKNNDLYQFHQSQDLANFSSPHTSMLLTFLLGECHSWIQDVTGIELNNKLAVTYSVYKDTDYLLCHDDKCEDRRIAFILYLNEDWKDTDGGGLQLFSTSENGQPLEVAHSILPVFNEFVFFEVTDKSFHQVAEVLASDKSRITVNGWFHSPIHCSRSSWNEHLVTKYSPQPVSDPAVLKNYINSCYLDKKYYSEVSGIFEEESQISLINFLKDDIYEELCNALLSNDVIWEKKGPPHRRQYYVPKDESVPACVKSFMEFFSSSAVFTFLSKLTNLELGQLDEKDRPESTHSCSNTLKEPKYYCEIQKWEKGCYTLLNDDDPTFKESALDAVIFFNVDGLDEALGGFTSYIARDEDLELLTVNPVENALALSYRDDETLRFVKYINHNFTGTFYSIHFVYNE